MEPVGFVDFLNQTATSNSGQYLTWKMLLRSMQFLLDIYDQDYDNYDKVGVLVYKWLNVPAMNVTFAAVEDMDIKFR